MALANGKFKGKGLSLTIDGTEYNMDFKTIVLDVEEADADDQSFADYTASGGTAQQWFFEGEAFADYGANSIWSYIWTNAGDDDVAFVFKPYGNATPTTSQPHFTGTLKVGGKPGGIGGTVAETFVFDVRFDVNGIPTKVTAA